MKTEIVNCLNAKQTIIDIDKKSIPEEKAKALFVSQNVAFKSFAKGLLVVAGIDGPIQFKARTGEFKAPGSSRFERGGVFSVLQLCEVGA